MFLHSDENINFRLRLGVEGGGTVTQAHLCKRKFVGRVLTTIGALPIISIDSLNIKVLEDQIITFFAEASFKHGKSVRKSGL